MSTYYEQGAVVGPGVRTQLTHGPCPQRIYIVVGNNSTNKQLQNSRIRATLTVWCKELGKEPVHFPSWENERRGLIDGIMLQLNRSLLALHMGKMRGRCLQGPKGVTREQACQSVLNAGAQEHRRVTAIEQNR